MFDFSSVSLCFYPLFLTTYRKDVELIKTEQMDNENNLGQRLYGGNCVIQVNKTPGPAGVHILKVRVVKLS